MNIKWYELQTGNHQGLIADEKTGENIAVCYDKKHAPIIAAAPAMYDALTFCKNWFEKFSPTAHCIDGVDRIHPMLETINKALSEADAI